MTVPKPDPTTGPGSSSPGAFLCLALPIVSVQSGTRLGFQPLYSGFVDRRPGVDNLMLEIVILAAGEGKRMHSGQPKVLQPVGGRAMLEHLLDAAAALDPGRLHVVIGAGADQIRRHCAGRPFGWVEQKARRGTGHALMQALPQLGTSSRVLVLPGDMPLIRPETLGKLLSRDADLALLTFVADDPTGYGRILRSEGHVSGVREERDASEAERAIREVNSGVMLASAGDWSAWLQQIDDDNAQGEYYLTDCIGVAAAEGRTIDAVVAGDAAELKGANDRGPAGRP